VHLIENLSEEADRKWPMRGGMEWPRDRWRHVTLEGQGHDPNTLTTQYLDNVSRCYSATTVNCNRQSVVRQYGRLS